jgi:predicted alpha/beta superfamily hydrolase
MRPILIISMALFATVAHAQHRVTFVLRNLPAQYQQDTVWLAGNFNGWHPGHGGYFFAQNGATQQLTTTLAAGRYEYKCTRGSWQKTECAANGADVANRGLLLQSDTTVYIDIAGWKDAFGTAAQPHTASAGVRVMADSFYMPQLGRYRRIWLYLPANYTKNYKRYPVLYMHDGQNLFNEATAPFGEWGLDECLDSLGVKYGVECIVVGIDNGNNKRMNEYNPYAFANFGPGEGDAYVEFLVKTLKPHIDGHYRTLPGETATGIAGSSMGGLISLYATLKYPRVFGLAGIFSPAFWTAPALDNYIDSLPGNISARLFFYAGGQESKDMVPDMERIADKLALKSNYFMYSVVEAEGKHNEPTWRRWLPTFLLWAYVNRAE